MIRSNTTIIKGLLRRAFRGESRYNLTEMKGVIAERLIRSRTLSDGETALLAAIRAVDKETREARAALQDAGIPAEKIGPESRALKRLQLAEKLAGEGGKVYLALPESVRIELESADMDRRATVRMKPSPRMN